MTFMLFVVHDSGLQEASQGFGAKGYRDWQVILRVRDQDGLTCHKANISDTYTIYKLSLGTQLDTCHRNQNSDTKRE